MASPHYTPTGAPIQGAFGQSLAIRDEFQAIETAIQVMNSIPITLQWNDANGSDPGASLFVVVPWACNIVAAYAVNHAANAGADNVLTIEINGVLVTMPVFEFDVADTVDTVISSVPTAQNSVAAGGSIEVITDAGGSSVMPVTVTLVLERT